MIHQLSPTSPTASRLQTAEEYAYDHVRHSILSGVLPGGTHLHQDEIAAELGLSRMPVRQAIRRLESEGFVVNRPNRGAVVTTLGPDAILELFEMRSVLEGLALRLATPNIGPLQLKEVAGRIDAMDQSQSDIALWIRLHDDLHEYLCQCAGKARLTAAVRHLRHSVTPYIRLYLSAYERAEIFGLEHHALLDTLEKGNPNLNEKMMRAHAMSAAKGVVKFVKMQAETQRAG